MSGLTWVQMVDTLMIKHIPERNVLKKFNLIFSVRDVKSLLDIYPFNKYLVSSAPKPFQIVFPKQVKKKGLDVVSTREHQISHHVSLWTPK